MRDLVVSSVRASPAKPRRAPRLRRVPGDDALFVAQLLRLHAAERALAFALPDLSRRSPSVALGLVLSDHRRVTNLQIIRLELMIQAATGGLDATAAAATFPGGPPGDDQTDLGLALSDSADTLLAVPLAASRVAVAGYRSAIASAKRLGQYLSAELLSASLREKDGSAIVLCELADQAER